MENKRGSLSTVFLVIAIILIVVMGAFMYMQKTESDRQIAELKSNANELQEAINKLQENDDLTTNTINSKDIYEKCENKFSNVEYRRDTGGSSWFFIKDGVLYSGEEDLSETISKTTGVEGKAKYVVPVDKQTGIAIVLNENGKLFINEGLSDDFSAILKEHKILEIINIPNEDGHLLLASDGKVLKLDGTLYLDLLKDDNNSTSEATKYVELTKELNSKDVLYVTKAEKNSDNTYTLYGVVFNCNENVNPDYQISDTWTVSKDYKKVTVSSDTKCISGYPEEEETTVGKYFNNYEEVELEKVVENTTLTDEYTYSFKFENGKCVEVIDYCTGV